jgi:hypothetical protein
LPNEPALWLQNVETRKNLYVYFDGLCGRFATTSLSPLTKVKKAEKVNGEPGCQSTMDTNPRHALNSWKYRMNLGAGFAGSATESFTNKRRKKIDGHRWIYLSLVWRGEGEHHKHRAWSGEKSKNPGPLLPVGVHE